nr:ADP-ribosylglycohydrolase family protein [Kibdelosporangium sp. MJ126-NF4]
MSEIEYEEVPVVDTEWDELAVPGVPTPTSAILRWERVPLNARWLPNGPARPNPDYVESHSWRGHRRPANRLELLVSYYRSRWITHEIFLQHVLDCEVYLPAESGGQEDAVTVPVAGSLDKVRSLYSRVVRTQLKVWRRTANPRHSVLITVGVKLSNVSISTEELFGTQALDTPEIEPTELVLPELEPDVSCGDLNRAAREARADGWGFSVSEARAYGQAAHIWRSNLELRRAGRPETWPEDPRSVGLIERYDKDGSLRPRPWNFGKFSEQAPYSVFSAFAMSGAYVGFALGEALGLLAETGQHPDGVPLHWGDLTHRMLAQSVAVLRCFYDYEGDVPTSLPVDGEPSWLTAVLGDELPPLTEPAGLLTAALPATSACNGRVGADANFGVHVAWSLCRAAGDHDASSSIGTLVEVQYKMMHHEFRWPVRVPLEGLAGSEESPDAMAQTILDMRTDRGADDEDQLNSLGDGRSAESVLSRALLAAAKRDYDPATALLLAVSHSGNRPLTGAITGALLGARHGTAGLPATWVATLDRLGIVENMAEDMYTNFATHGIWREDQEDREKWRQRYWPTRPVIDR